MLFPAHLVELRLAARLTQEQCAKMALAGLRTWKHWEAGTRAMPLAAIELWCMAVLAGKHLERGEWCIPWVRKEFMRLF